MSPRIFLSATARFVYLSGLFSWRCTTEATRNGHHRPIVSSSPRRRRRCTKCWEEFKKAVYKNLAINIGNPSDMVTGAAFQKFSSDSARAFFVSLLNEEDAEDFNFILLGLSAAVKVINSQKRRVNTEKLRELSLVPDFKPTFFLIKI